MKHFTRTGSGIYADTNQAVVALTFGTGTKLQAYQRSQAVEALAPFFQVQTIRQTRLVKQIRRDATTYKAPAPDPRRLDITGAPADVARFFAAVPHILDKLEKLATRCARRVGTWLRSAAGQTWVEDTNTTPDGVAYERRMFRSNAFDHLVALTVNPHVEYPVFPDVLPPIRDAYSIARQEFFADFVDPLSFADEDEAAAVLAGLKVIDLDETADPADVRDVLDAAAEVVDEAAAEIEQDTAAAPAPEGRPVPAGLTVVPVPTAWRTWYAVDCIRCTGQLTKVVDEVATRDEAVDLAWDHYDARHRSADEALTLREIDEAEALAAALSRAQYDVLWTIQTGEILEDGQGFFTYSLTTDAPVKVSQSRVVRLLFAGYLSAHAEGEYRRTFRLTAKGDRARRLLFRATRHGVVELGTKDGRLDVPAAKMRRYPFLADGHPVRCGLLPEAPAPAAVPDTVDEVLAAAGDQAPADVVDQAPAEARELVAAGCATTPQHVGSFMSEPTAPARAHREEPEMTDVKLTPAQTEARTAMRKNDGWAKKGGPVSRRTFAALVDKGLATWTINTPGGWWAGYLNESVAAADAAAESKARMQIADRVREHYPAANTFQPVVRDGQTVAHTFITGPLPTGMYGWVLPDGTLSPRLAMTRERAEDAVNRRTAAEAPALADPVAVFADEIEAREDEAAQDAENTAHRAAKDRFTHAHTFKPLDEDGRTVAWIFTAGLGSGAKMGWVSARGQVCARTYMSRHDATLAAQAHVATQAAAKEAPAPVVATADEAREIVAKTFPNAQGFRPRTNDTGRITGWTFRTDGTDRARFSWVTTDGSYGKGTEGARVEAAQMLVVGILEDARARARRDQMVRYDRLTDLVEAQYPEANMWRKVRTPENTTAGWTFRTGYGMGARYGWVHNDGTMSAPDADLPGRIEADADARQAAVAAAAICAI